MPATHKPLIDVRPDHWAIVRDILQKHVPQYEVWAFGSRAKWSAKEYSDLDLAVITDHPLSIPTSAALADDFAESDLPWKVDVVDWATTAESFRKIIKRDKVVVQKAAGMSEWIKATLDQIKATSPNAIAMGPFGSRIKTDNFVPSGVPVIRGGNLNAPRLLDDGFVFLTEEKADELRASNARPGDIVITHRGTIGQVGIIPYDAHYPRYVVSQSQMKFTVDAKKADPYFIYYFLRSTIGQHQLLANTSQVGVPAIAQPTTSLKAIEVLLPPTVDEQRAIAHILGTLDDKIELNRRMNETLEAIARALFKSWFVDFDPVRAKMSGELPEAICQRLGLTPDLLALFPDSLVDSELGEIPEGWSISTLAIEAERHGGFIQTGPFGSQLHAADYVTEGVPVVMPQDLVNRRVSLARIVRVTHEMAKRLSRHALKPGDVVYSRRGDVERHALVSDREAGWLCGTGCLLVRLGDAWPSQAYLSEVLDLPVTREWLVRHAVGATMPNLNTSILGSVPLLLPSEPVLLAFEAIANPLRKQQIAASTENDVLALVRDALLPKLLSGELSVPTLGNVSEECLL